MKRTLSLIIAILLSMSMLTACGKSEFSAINDSDKHMTITAQNAARDDFFGIGTLKVEEGEEIHIAADLSKGSVRVEIVPVPEDQSIEEVVDIHAEAVLTANLSSTDEANGTLEPGSYMLRAACLEKADGTIEIEILPGS